MSNKVYVGGLSYATTDKQLEDLFAAHGTVESAGVIMDKFSGRSKGFGFVAMSSSAEAQRAIQTRSGAEVGGRNITANEARPQERRSGVAAIAGEAEVVGAIAGSSITKDASNCMSPSLIIVRNVLVQQT